MQIIPLNSTSNPQILLGYGYVGVWTEFSASGQVLCDNRFPQCRLGSREACNPIVYLRLRGQVSRVGHQPLRLEKENSGL
jgi:hypothetical protein